MSTISITTSVNDQLIAAHSLSEYLDKLNCRHAYIGGFAWALLGSQRSTEMSRCLTKCNQDRLNSFYDIDVLVETDNIDILTLREQLTELNPQFASAGIKFFYVKEPIENLQGSDLVRSSKDNIMIETLRAGTLGLPTAVQPVYRVENPAFPGGGLNILHPSILILTKMKRWLTTKDSDRPKTVTKNRSDQADIVFMINWLASNKMFIDFESYEGKTKADLIQMVRSYRNTMNSDVALMEELKMVIRPEDWEELCGDGSA